MTEADEFKRGARLMAEREFGALRSIRPHIRTTEEAAMEREMSAKAQEAHTQALQRRTAARQDAVVVVARARARGGATPTAWSAFDADAIHLITDLLLKLQGQEPTPLDLAFQTRDEKLAKIAGLTGRIEEAIKRGERADEAVETDPGRQEGGQDEKSDGSGA